MHAHGFCAGHVLIVCYRFDAVEYVFGVEGALFVGAASVDDAHAAFAAAKAIDGLVLVIPCPADMSPPPGPLPCPLTPLLL